jgi:hypothetical protein
MRRVHRKYPARIVADHEIAEHEQLVRDVLAEMRLLGDLGEDLDQDELEQVGRIAVWQALSRCVPLRSQLTTYLAQAVREEAREYQKREALAKGWDPDPRKAVTVVSLDALTERAEREYDDLVA